MQPTKDASDVVVVGGGPVGSFAAWKLAKLGAEVTVFEEHEAIGKPSHCAGHMSIRSLRNLGLYPLLCEIVENTYSQANLHSPTGFTFSVHLAKPVTCSVNREDFDRHIADKAENAGARYCLNSRVQSLLMENGVVKGVTVPRQKIGFPRELWLTLREFRRGFCGKQACQGLTAEDLFTR
jgi:digeranylgeranylglycerophospholipid reductase